MVHEVCRSVHDERWRVTRLKSQDTPLITNKARGNKLYNESENNRRIIAEMDLLRSVRDRKHYTKLNKTRPEGFAVHRLENVMVYVKRSSCSSQFAHIERRPTRVK